MLLHDRQMHGITRGYLAVPHYNFFGALGCGPVHGKHLIGDAKQGIECWLDGIAPVYCHIAVQDLLQNLGIRNQAFPIADEVFQQALRVGLMGMGSANEVHGDIRVD